MLAVLAVEVEPHQTGVGVVLGLGRTLGLLGTEMSERLHFRLAVRFHLEKNYYFDWDDATTLEQHQPHKSLNVFLGFKLN